MKKLIVFALLLAHSSCAVNSTDEVGSSYFSWESLFGKDVDMDSFENITVRDISSIESFLTSFGGTLDHCNDKLEEASAVSRDVIREFVANMVQKNSLDSYVEDVMMDDVTADPTVLLTDNAEHALRTPERKSEIWENLDEVLSIIRQACDDLPVKISEKNLHQNHTEQQHFSYVLENILTKMTEWGTFWNEKVRDSARNFLDTCIDNSLCEKNLKVIFEIVSATLENDSNFPEISEEQPLGSNYFWERISSMDESYSGNITDINSYLRSKLQNMAGIIGHFGQSSETEDEQDDHEDPLQNEEEEQFDQLASFDDEVEHGDSFSTVHDEDYDEARIRRLIAAAVNVLRYPWRVDDSPNIATLVVEGRSPQHTVLPSFLSMAMGSSKTFQEPGIKELQSEKLKNLLSELTPMVLRVGGTSANLMTFQETQHEEQNEDLSDGPSPKHPKLRRRRSSVRTHPKLTHPDGLSKFNLTSDQLHHLITLCEALNGTLLFDLNQLTRTATGGWDPRQADLIVAQFRASACRVVWQLGNEPNAYRSRFNVNMTGEQMAEDYEALRKVTSPDFWDRLTSMDQPPLLVGPDVSNVKDPEDELRINGISFIEDFLTNPAVVDILSWHHYYVDGHAAVVHDFLSPSVMETYRTKARLIRAIRDQKSPQLPIWNTESGSAYGGGALELSDRFAGSFLWLDKLGVAAQEGVQLVARQAVLGGHYALFEDSLHPTPDYWVSVLYKPLVGTKVLAVTLEAAPTTVRLYAHCAKDASGVVVFGLNTGEDAVPVDVFSNPHDNTTTTSPTMVEYVLAPRLGDVTSRSTLLNSRPLVAFGNGTLPPLEGKTVQNITVQPLTIAFWWLPDLDIPACHLA